jgi:hypothetical protein
MQQYSEIKDKIMRTKNKLERRKKRQSTQAYRSSLEPKADSRKKQSNTKIVHTHTFIHTGHHSGPFTAPCMNVHVFDGSTKKRQSCLEKK